MKNFSYKLTGFLLLSISMFLIEPMGITASGTTCAANSTITSSTIMSGDDEFDLCDDGVDEFRTGNNRLIGCWGNDGICSVSCN